jgi:hypothetical protein
MAALFAASSAHADLTTTYTFDLTPGLPTGNPITNIMIFEVNADGSEMFIDYGNNPGGYTINGVGPSSISHTSLFEPSSSFIMGLTQLPDKTSFVMFMNEAFAATAAGHLFSAVFVSERHNALIDRLLSAQTGDPVQLAWFEDVFYPADGSRAAFATSGPKVGMMFTGGVVVTPVPEHGTTALLFGLASLSLFLFGRKLRPLRR